MRTSSSIRTLCMVAVMAVDLVSWPAGFANAVEVVYVGAIRGGLSAPTSIVAGADQIAALEPFSRQVLAFTPDGAITDRIDISGGAHGLAALSPSVYAFCDRTRGQVVAVDLSGSGQSVFFEGLADPADLTTAGGTCYVLDAATLQIVGVDGSGRMVSRIDLSAAPEITRGAPSALAWDASDGSFHVFDQPRSQVHVFAADGRYQTSYASFGNEPGTVTRGGGMACDADGYTYILDRYQGRIAVFDPSHEFVLDIDPGELIGERLNVPAGISVDEQGTIYASSTEEDCIHVFFLDKTAVPEGTLAAAPLSPSPSSTVNVGDVVLVARLAADASMGSALAADFQIRDALDPDVVVAEVAGIAADEVGVGADARLVGTASWSPGDVIEADRQYQWTTRARAGTRVGQWSDPVTFFTRPAALRRELEPNYPNPFNPQTTIAFTLPATERAVLEIYSLTGTRVWSRTFDNLTGGRHTVIWDGRDNAGEGVASGVYFYRLSADGFTQTRKMVLVR